ncbi:MAG: response regulator transcription factor [Candidatus Gastranaerophilales bacterium]|nr:response regulator transcription factor [Candidatus Gastranaerophilales bacterium]
MRILLVEDDKNLAGFVKKGLSEEGYAVDLSFEGEEGKFLALTNDYDLIILDIMLPGIDGISLCKTIRLQKKDIPILFLSAKDEIQNKVKGLDSGANDYLTKPFAFPELTARIRALLRLNTSSENKDGVLTVGELSLNLFTHKCKRNKIEYDLSGKEFSLLEYFMRNPDRVLTRTMIIEHVWNYDFDNFTNVVDVYINYIRNKIDKEYDFKMLITYRGSGYMLRSKE